MTFSILAFDAPTGDLGIAVASKFLAVGAVVPWARAGIGAVATQAYANTAYGPRGLALLAGGATAAEALGALTRDDAEAGRRQVGVVDARGGAATFTGGGCHAWAGGRTGEHYACQGNILVSGATVDAMAETFEQASGDLASRLLVALAAGQAAGGDSRGQQSAALLVVRRRCGYGGWNDRYVDLRVDDHVSPIDELARLLGLWRLHFERPHEADLLELTPALAREVRDLLRRAGAYRGPSEGPWDQATATALADWAGAQNLEERLCPAKIDRAVLGALRSLAPPTTRLPGSRP